MIRSGTIAFKGHSIRSSLLFCFFVLLNLTLGKQEGKARRFVYSTLHQSGISNPFLFWMFSTALFRISTITSYYDRAEINLGR